MSTIPDAQEIVRPPRFKRPKLPNAFPNGGTVPHSTLYHVTSSAFAKIQTLIEQHRVDNPSLLLSGIASPTRSTSKSLKRTSATTDPDDAIVWLINCGPNGVFPPWNRTCLVILYRTQFRPRTIYLFEDREARNEDFVLYATRISKEIERGWEEVAKLEVPWFQEAVLNLCPPFAEGESQVRKEPGIFLERLEGMFRGRLLRERKWYGRWRDWCVNLAG
jgi:hypothetical protein